MLFFKKKEDSLGLPDLPPSQVTNLKPITREVPMPPETQNSKPGFSKIEEDNDDEDDNEMFEKHALPSFPDAPNVKGFSQAAIKDAVGTGKEESELPEIHPAPINIPKAPPLLPKLLPKAPEAPTPSKNFKTMEMEEWTPEKTMQAPKATMPMQKGSNIYVRLDKFHTAKRSLEDIKSKVEEVETLLNKIREIKMREEQELSGWEKDIFGIKSRLQDVTDNIFEKGD